MGLNGQIRSRSQNEKYKENSAYFQKKRSKVKFPYSWLRILDIHDFISDMVLLHTKNKAVSLKVANSVVHVYKDEGIGLP